MRTSSMCVSAMFAVTVWPVETVTEVVPTASSPLYTAKSPLSSASAFRPPYDSRVCVYVPGFIFGDVNAPEESALTQYCAFAFAQPIVILSE